MPIILTIFMLHSVNVVMVTLNLEWSKLYKKNYKKNKLKNNIDFSEKPINNTC